ncbi:MAG: hypothetical protein R8K22_03040 [Mariprofundaceae bacterium]
MKHILFCMVVLMIPVPPAFAEEQEYLYYRDINVPPYQKLREFFDLPNRPGNYEVTLVSDAVGPLTFHLIRVEEEKETTINKHRSYSLKDHEFHVPFTNRNGKYDLIVEMANSNPASKAKVSVFVIEQP